ncbi:hypothetical protein [Bradyrhizobium niftali]|uniref:Uncharacterized protein n=1 Tax=Bradyrhizobium niftali TaxID=2560055 RepID=A0A4Y9L3J2_9BRAD|nr:hypothetical protein [Bradyrhizobium niftali]TFV37975.1 hypothetical protein E4K65_42580 [Bradyrhizobium niftali]
MEHKHSIAGIRRSCLVVDWLGFVDPNQQQTPVAAETQRCNMRFRMLLITPRSFVLITVTLSGTTCFNIRQNGAIVNEMGIQRWSVGRYSLSQWSGSEQSSYDIDHKRPGGNDYSTNRSARLDTDQDLHWESQSTTEPRRS